MNEFKEFRMLTGMRLTEFSKIYKIPYRTLQNWEYGISKPPEYLINMMKKIWEDRNTKKC